MAEQEMTVFHGLLTSMLSADNTVRSTAEDQYKDIALGKKASLLFQMYTTAGVPDENRSLALVLLRRLVSSEWDELAPALGQENLSHLCAEVLRSAGAETNEHLRKKLGDLIAELARSTIDDDTGAQKWREVIDFVQHCAQTDSSELKEMALSLIEDVPNIFGNDSATCLPGVKALLEQCLQHVKPSVRSAAVKAFVSYIVDNDEDDRTVKTLGQLAPIIIKVCEHVVVQEEDDDTPLQCLADLATSLPKVLQPHLAAVITMCCATIRDAEKEEAYRHSAMEVVTSLCESAANMVKKRAANYIQDILTCCVIMMTELSDDTEEWLAIDNVEDDDENEETVAVGESSLDRIACSLNGKVVVPVFLPLANQLLVDPDWKKRHAGLMGLSTIGEGCQRNMESIIQQIVHTIVPFLRDPHPRVRYAACNALGQMSTDFAPTLQKKCHSEVVPALLEALSDITISRVSAHAGAALVNFSEDCPKTVISAYLLPMMQKLEEVLEKTFQNFSVSGKKIILEQVITTIASVADASQNLFVNYYDRLIGPLKFILNNSGAEEFKILRGKTIECISLIGLAVGAEKFGHDAGEVMRALGPSMETLQPDDPQCSYFISSWTRICKVLGPAFAEYLPLVMPPIMRAAKYSPEVAVVDDEDLAAQEGDADWTFHSVGEKKNFGIRTSGIEEKATACDMLVCYARELKEAFEPYVVEVATMMVGHLQFFFHEGVRQSAAETLPHLLACVKAKGVPEMRTLWIQFWPALQKAISAEVEIEVTSELVNCVGECIEQLGRNGLTVDELQQIGAMMAEQLDEYDKRRLEREQAETDEDADPDEAKEELDEEAEAESSILARISDVIHAGFKTVGADWYLVVEPLIKNHFLKLAEPQRVYSERQWSICVFDDLIEFAPQHSLPLVQPISTVLMHALRDEFPEVRQAAAYGFGAMAMNGHVEWANCAVKALDGLAAMIEMAGARDTEEGAVATENAISAAAKIIRHCSQGANVDPYIARFMGWLPIWNDQEEAVHVYGFLADLVEGNNPAALGGPSNANLPKIFDIIVKAFHHSAFDDSTEAGTVKGRLLSIIKFMQSTPEILKEVLANSQTTEEERATLQQILQG